jgi:hypothetical protein
MDATAQTFIAKWRKASGSERANDQLFITGLCELPGCGKPDRLYLKSPTAKRLTRNSGAASR